MARATSKGISDTPKSSAHAGNGARTPTAQRPMIVSTGDAVTRPLKTAEAVARDLVHTIVSSGLKPGDRLPSEAAMLEELTVSRESLREGLRLLEVQGLISLRRGPGGGPVVGHLDPANLGRTSTLYYHLAGGTYADLLEAWVVMDSMLAERAARNPDREAVRAAMAPFLEETEPPLDEQVVSFVTSHTRFHAEVAALAQNRVLEMTLQTVGQIVTHHVLMHADPRSNRALIESEHIEIAKAIVAGQPQKAQRAMADHIRTMISVHKADLGAQMYDLIDWR